MLALFLLAGLYSAQAQSDWLRAESPHFVVYGDGAESWIRQQVLLLEDFDQLLRATTNVGDDRAPHKLEVYLVRGARQLRTIYQLGRDIGGFYAASPGGTLAVVDVRAQVVTAEVLLHEYVHHFMFQYAAGAYPSWYVEGLAEYFSTAEFDDDFVVIGRHPRRMSSYFLTDGWLPMDRVLFGHPHDLTSTEVPYFYTQSWAATHFFNSSDERKASLRRYLAAIFAGAEPREAFTAETGFTPRALDNQLRAYLGNRRVAALRAARDSARAAPSVEVSVLPPSSRTLLLHRAALRIGLPEDQVTDHLRRIRQAAARHEGDEFAQRVLAHAEAVYGDPAAADRLLDALLERDPDDAELLYLKGMRHFVAAPDTDEREAELAMAREWFGRAFQADDNHFQTLFRYAQTLRDDPRYASDNNANVLLLALQIAPQVAVIRRETASVLMARSDLELAHAVLMPLATDPHRREMAAWAQEQIEWIRDRTAAEGREEHDPERPSLLMDDAAGNRP